MPTVPAKHDRSPGSAKASGPAAKQPKLSASPQSQIPPSSPAKVKPDRSIFSETMTINGTNIKLTVSLLSMTKAAKNDPKSEEQKAAALQAPFDRLEAIDAHDTEEPAEEPDL